MNYEEIKAAAKARMESPILAGMSELYKAGMAEGFIDGAMWAIKQIDKQSELLEQVETLKKDVENLKNPKE